MPVFKRGQSGSHEDKSHSKKESDKSGKISSEDSSEESKSATTQPNIS